MGAFEGIRCYLGHDGRSAVFRLREHVRRLVQSVHILGLSCPYGEEAIAEACLETIRANDLKECYIRPLVYVADGEMGLAATSNPVRLSVATWKWGSYLGEEGLANGIRAISPLTAGGTGPVGPKPKLNERPEPPGAKLPLHPEPLMPRPPGLRSSPSAKSLHQT